MQIFHRGASKSLFYWTLMMEYRGLSRFGRFLQAVCHVGMDVRTYDRWRKSEVDKYSKLLSELSTNQLVLFCYDNYNKKYGNPRVDLEREDIYTLLNVCVVGLSLCETKIDMKFIYENGGMFCFLSCTSCRGYSILSA